MKSRLRFCPEEFSRDADLVSRFQREAEILASLSHPNIAGIYSLEEADGSRYLVLELVEGETLANHIARGPIPVQEALDIAKSICEALEAAHEKGVIHRDLKPANVKITPEGKVKVLDFGLAKMMDPGSSNPSLSKSPTVNMAATQQGIILGTASYMSPEQARGKRVDKRTDVWAFGCVLYEMLTGKRGFEGEDISDTLASVLRAEPDWNALPGNTAPTLRTLIQRCVAKDRAQRIADMSVVKFLLAEPAFTGTPSPRPRSRLRTILLIATVVVLSIAAGGALVWKLRPPTATALVVKFVIDLPEGQTFNSGQRNNLAISNDGTQIVYAWNSRLYHRFIWELEARPIAGSENDDLVTAPVFHQTVDPLPTPQPTSLSEYPSMAEHRQPLVRRSVLSPSVGVRRALCSCRTTALSGFRPTKANRRRSLPPRTTKQYTDLSYFPAARVFSSPSPVVETSINGTKRKSSYSR